MSTMIVSENLSRVRNDISEAASAAGRAPNSVKLVAVSKRKPLEAVQAAYSAGQRDFGENRVQELMEKAPAMPDDVRWHLIGTLQSNKVKHALEHSYLIHSVDSEKLLRRIDRLAGEMDKVQNILLQANISGEESKSGLDLDALAELTRIAIDCPNIRLHGYMTMAPYGATKDELLDIFGSLKAFRDDMETSYSKPFPELSMGMSGDFCEAIACGATYVRIGTAIFGDRNP